MTRQFSNKSPWQWDYPHFISQTNALKFKIAETSIVVLCIDVAGFRPTPLSSAIRLGPRASEGAKTRGSAKRGSHVAAEALNIPFFNVPTDGPVQPVRQGKLFHYSI